MLFFLIVFAIICHPKAICKKAFCCCPLQSVIYPMHWFCVWIVQLNDTFFKWSSHNIFCMPNRTLFHTSTVLCPIQFGAEKTTFYVWSNEHEIDRHWTPSGQFFFSDSFNGCISNINEILYAHFFRATYLSIRFDQKWHE